MIWLEIDPNVVKPGWTPLMITVGLGIAVVLLFFSMRRQFRRINLPDDELVEDARSDGTDSPPPAAAPPTAAPPAGAATTAPTAPAGAPPLEKE